MVTEAEARAKVDAEAPAETQAANDSPGSGEGKGHGHIPMSDSTQWDIVNGQAERVEPVWEELVWQAAQGDVVHHDDTGVKILELMGERARQAALEDSGGDTAEDSAEDAAKELPPDRTGMFTSAIVATGDGRRAQDRVVPQRTPARRGEPKACAAAACGGIAPAHPNV